MLDVAGGVRCREDVAQRVATAIGRTQKGVRRSSSDGYDGCSFDGRRLGLVGDQLAQEWNQHDELS